MTQRRDFLKTSLTICSCVICGELGIGASGSAAAADGPTVIRGAGYDLWFVGAQRETIMNGKLAAALDLKTLAERPHLYGVGPIEQLRGEVTIADSRPALARVGPDGAVEVTQSFDAGAAFLVWAEVPRWVEHPIRAEIRSYEDLERFVPQAAAAAGLDADQPLPFLVAGREDLIEFHILNRIGDAPHNMETHMKIRPGSNWSGSRRRLSAFTRPAIAASSHPATATSTSISRRPTTASQVIFRGSKLATELG